MDWIMVRYEGKKAMVVDHVRMRPGDRREVSGSGWERLQEEWPGLFVRVGTRIERIADDSEISGSEEERTRIGRISGSEDEEIGLEELGLSGRVREALEGAGVTSVAMLGEMEDGELLAIRGIGMGAVREIREALGEVKDESTG